MPDIWAQRGAEMQQKLDLFLQNQKSPLPADLQKLCNEFWVLCNQLIASDTDGGSFAPDSSIMG